MVALRIMVSAGEASGDLYAARLVERLREHLPDADFFGCAGPEMKAAGVRPVADVARLSVVGLLEVVAHIPRVYGEYRKMVRSVWRDRPHLAILTDSPDFHLRLAAHLKKAGVPVVYFVAPQVWAWRRRRIRAIKCNIDRLLCIFPFEEDFFRRHGVAADYIGHPLATLVKPAASREVFFRKYGLSENRAVVSLLPGSRRGEAFRHLPHLLDAVARIRPSCDAQFVLATPAAFWRAGDEPVLRRLREQAVICVAGETWDVLANSDLALAASGTVTIEAAFLGAPLVTYYRVTAASWLLGRFLVDVPFYSMVNLVAGKAIVPELMQNEMRGERLAAEALRILADPGERERMRSDLARVAALLSGHAEPMQRAADVVRHLLTDKHGVSYVA